jgi:hypothetical protein
MKTMNPHKISEAKEMQSIVDTAFKQNQLMWVLWNNDKDKVIIITM